MDIRINTRNVDINDTLKDYMESKMSKLEKFFSKILDSQVVISFNRGRYTVEVTSNANGVVMRGEDRDSDMRKAFDKALKNIERQVKRHKEYLKDRAKLKTHEVSLDIENLMNEFETSAEEEESEIVKRKRFDVKAMDPREATMQMDLLGHSFFVFKNMDTGKINVVYHRAKGGYGLLEPLD